MKSRNMMLATAIVAAFGLAGCNSNRAPDNGGTDSHHTETRATGGNTKTTGRVCQLLQDDNPNRGGRKVVYRCNGRAVLASDEAKRLLNPSVPVSFGGSGSVVQSNLITRQAANATGNQTKPPANAPSSMPHTNSKRPPKAAMPTASAISTVTTTAKSCAADSTTVKSALSMPAS